MLQEIPKIGLGTRKIQGTSVSPVLSAALELGYRHIDTAWIYRNEQEIGNTLEQLQFPRSQLWITTKVWFDYIPNYQVHTFVESDFSYTQLEKRFYQTLKDLNTDYLDLVLLHWPTNLDNDLSAFEKLLYFKKKGSIRHVGVSNFSFSALQALCERFPGEVYMNQIEWHPLLAPPGALLEFAQKNQIFLTAYSPFAQGHLFYYQGFLDIAHRFNCDPSQLALAYLLYQGAVVIPKASSPERLSKNFEASSFTLSDAIIKELDALPKHFRYCNPPFAHYEEKK